MDRDDVPSGLHYNEIIRKINWNNGGDPDVSEPFPFDLHVHQMLFERKKKQTVDAQSPVDELSKQLVVRVRPETGIFIGFG